MLVESSKSNKDDTSAEMDNYCSHINNGEFLICAEVEPYTQPQATKNPVIGQGCAT